MWPSTSATNQPDWLSLVPKHIGFEFSRRQGRSETTKLQTVQGKILKTNVVP